MSLSCSINSQSNKSALVIQNAYQNAWKQRTTTYQWLDHYAECIAKDPTDELAQTRFKYHAQKLNKQIDDRLIDAHVQRLGGREGLHHKAKSFEKDIIMLHEKSEIVSMRKMGKVRLHQSGRRPKALSEEELKQSKQQETETIPEFYPAHQKAVDIENAYYLCKAKEVKAPLSLKALNFFRYADDCSTYYVPNLTDKSKRGALLKDLSSKPIPTLQETKDLIEFITTHVYSADDALFIGKKHWLKYTLAVLYEENKSKGIRYINLLFILVAYLQSDYWHRDIPIQNALEPLRNSLSNAKLCEDDQEDPNWEKRTFKQIGTDDKELGSSLTSIGKIAYFLSKQTKKIKA